MNCRSAGHVLAMVLAVADFGGLLSSATGQGSKPETPQAPDRHSGRSSPPDTTPYVRPLIPEDRMTTPKPQTPQAPDRDSQRSSPPDTTPYVRPVIPQDRMRQPKSQQDKPDPATVTLTIGNDTGTASVRF
jgi:hypothetical protein